MVFEYKLITVVSNPVINRHSVLSEQPEVLIIILIKSCYHASYSQKSRTTLKVVDNLVLMQSKRMNVSRTSVDRCDCGTGALVGMLSYAVSLQTSSAAT